MKVPVLIGVLALIVLFALVIFLVRRPSGNAVHSRRVGGPRYDAGTDMSSWLAVNSAHDGGHHGGGQCDSGAAHGGSFGGDCGAAGSDGGGGAGAH